MLPLVPKAWSKARATLTSEWSASLSAHWDTAIRGSSALRAALVRSLMDEVGL